jgi:hypothetical protein
MSIPCLRCGTFLAKEDTAAFEFHPRRHGNLHWGKNLPEELKLFFP